MSEDWEAICRTEVEEVEEVEGYRRRDAHEKAIAELKAEAVVGANAHAVVMAAICSWDPYASTWMSKQSKPYTFAVIPNPLHVLAGFECSEHTLHCEVVMVAGNHPKHNEALRQFALATIKEFKLPMVDDPNGVLCLVPKYKV